MEKNKKKQSETVVLPVQNHGNCSSLMTTVEAAEFLNLKVSRIRNMVFLKSIPFIKFGASVRFDKSQLESWVKTKMVLVN